jgi:hypothetical protein
MKPAQGEAQGNIAADIVFSIISCGIYGLFWQNRLFKAANALLDEDKYSFWPWFLLTLVTCGIYNMYAQYQVGESLHAGLRKEGLPGNENLGILALVLSVFGLHLVAMAIDQHEINKLYR